MRQLVFCFLVALLTGCNNNDSRDPSSTKKNFIQALFESDIGDGPFAMSYSLKTVLYSKTVISLFGHTDVYTYLPHSCGYYEGKTYCKISGRFKEIALSDLFATPQQKEFLRAYCENNLKQRSHGYFDQKDPLRDHLDENDIHTFVVDERSLIIIFSPYCVGNYVDGPHFIQIPYEALRAHWNPQNPLAKLLPITTFVSSWDFENFYSQLPKESESI
jgi:hypothetical protein